MNTYDVVIVGAGPAGFACALKLAQKNLSVALIEKNQLPAGKPCGEGILPNGVNQLKSLGILDFIGDDQQHKIDGIRYITAKHQAKASFINGVGLGINRVVLSSAFKKSLNQYPNIHLIKAEFKNYENSIVTVKEENLMRHIKTKFLVGADGLRSKVRSNLGIEIKKPYFKRWALTAHMPIKAWTSLVEIHLDKNIEAYVTPTGKNEINVVFMWDRSKKLPAKGKDLFFALIDNFPKLKKQMALYDLSHKAFAIGPFHYRAKNFFSKTHAALIGDAAGYIDPLTGEGINLGLYQGQLLAHIIGDKLRQNKRITQSDLQEYQRGALNYGRAHTWLTYIMLLMQKNNLFFELAMKIFKTYPWLLSSLTAISMGVPISALVAHPLTKTNPTLE
ncbi:MAG: NAD(P)/FAD-dependent oxidoreductase [Myxococcales bacterium]|nr:NAD(P)/FAD-dependent oxidoreductase [Myxococcales bacterium]USN51464.1 MAG: NAD(P)/FAD-dependent oxidoreductase [Myxococcales bacterium]